MSDKQKEMFQQLWNFIGGIFGVVVNIHIIYNYAILHKEPSNMMIYVALLLYMQMFLMHKKPKKKKKDDAKNKPDLDLG